MSATPSSTGKDRPGRPAGSGSSSPNGLSRGNGGKPSSSSSGANSTVGPVTEPEETKAESPAVVEGPKDEAGTSLGSSVVSSASSAGAQGGSGAKTETADGNPATPPLGTPPVQEGQANDSSPPWSAGSESVGSVSAGQPRPAASPFAARETTAPAGAPAPGAPGPGGPGGPGAPGMSPAGPGVSSPGPGPAQPNRNASLGNALKERVNDVMRPGKASAGGKSPRKAHLQVSRLEPWSVMKFSFVMSLVCFIVLLVAVAVIYMILSGLGVFDQIVQTINELTQDKNAANNTFDAASWFSFTRIFGYTALVGALNVLLITALATVWSVIYNIAADFVGGIEVTLKEAE